MTARPASSRSKIRSTIVRTAMLSFIRGLASRLWHFGSHARTETGQFCVVRPRGMSFAAFEVVSTLDDRPLSELVQTAVEDVRELAQAEIALAKDELKTIGISLLIGVPIIVAALVLVSMTLSMLVASAVLNVNGTALQALWAASASNLLLAGGGVVFALRRLPKRSPQPRGASSRSSLSQANRELA
jgi:uncharacterized membrane protein YqjE